MTKIVFFLEDKGIYGFLTRLFTGCSAGHIGFLCEGSGWCYDMFLMRRRRKWPVADNRKLAIFESPVEVPEQYLIDKILDSGSEYYGFIDFLLFALRPFYRLVGRPVRNHDGIICSEMVNNDLIENGWASNWPKTSAPPSPCHLLRYFEKRASSARA
jgi:hypothetical protein